MKLLPPEGIDINIQRFLKTWNSYGGKYCKYGELERHDMLEFDAYVHITSPIRRLVDLLTMMKLQEKLGLVEWTGEANGFMISGHAMNQSNILIQQCVLYEEAK